MSKGPNPFSRPIPANAVCTQCGFRRPSLQWCCLTGSGDHSRRFILCAECLKDMASKSGRSNEPPSGDTAELSEDEIRRETRRQRAFNRLGTDNPICACCTENDWRCLELHHLEGKDYGKTLIRVCRNCHRKLSDAQKDHPAKLGEPPLTLEPTARLLSGLADMLPMIGTKLKEAAESLFHQAQRQASKTTRRRND